MPRSFLIRKILGTDENEEDDLTDAAAGCEGEVRKGCGYSFLFLTYMKLFKFACSVRKFDKQFCITFQYVLHVCKEL